MADDYAAADAVLALVRAEILLWAGLYEHDGCVVPAETLAEIADRIAPVPDQPEERT